MACWNPVLFRLADNRIVLFFKVGASPSQWHGRYAISHDNGKTWQEPRLLPEGILGPIKNKPIRLKDGTILCPSSTEDKGWQVRLERTKDLSTWSVTDPLNQPHIIEAIQPTILRHTDGRLQILCRTRHGLIAQAWSSDQGLSWTPLSPTDLPNPNSGIDAVTLADGRHLLVYNHSTTERLPLNVAISTDGIGWRQVLVLEDEPGGQYSYPAVIQTADGLVHVTYTYKRLAIKHVILDPGRF